MLSAAVLLCFLLGIAVSSKISGRPRAEQSLAVVCNQIALFRSQDKTRRCSRDFRCHHKSLPNARLGRSIFDRFRHCAAGFPALRDAGYAHGAISFTGDEPVGLTNLQFHTAFCGQKYDGLFDMTLSFRNDKLLSFRKAAAEELIILPPPKFFDAFFLTNEKPYSKFPAPFGNRRNF